MNLKNLFILIISLICWTLSAEAETTESFFTHTEIQLHAELERQPANDDLWTVTFEHFSKWHYGDNFFFLDIEGEPNFKTQADTLYFEYAPRLSLDRLLDTKLIPHESIGELYATVQYNESDQAFINRVWLYGLSVDLLGQPHHGFSQVHLLIRQEETQARALQLTLAWGQPFSLGQWRFVFQGFADYWYADDQQVLLAEPQLRFPLANLVGDDHWLSKAALGSEFELSRNFFGQDYGWELNPTLFLVLPF
ncbi:MAG: DUF5020 family protein [Pseudomonadota bacterium]|nr:DUF5020 family protein [Pseudomonadota bacterium]